MFVSYFSTCGMRSVIVLYFSAFGMRSGIVLFFLLVERALLLWSFVLYYSAYVTCSGIVKLCVTFSACGTSYGIVLLRVIFFRM